MASSQLSTVSGGAKNRAVGVFYNSVGGGENNTAGSMYATVGGGKTNTASGDYSMVPGGSDNTASGNYSFAAGRRAKALAAGTFVWADSQNADFSSSTPNLFAVRAQGGVWFNSGTLGFNQVVNWTPGDPAWNFTSDAATKEKFRSVDARDVLRRVASMPVTEWNYIGYSRRHIGPTAQDFHAVFPLNDSDKTINTADMHGVSLAAIKGLVEELKDRDKAMAERDRKIDELKEKNEELFRSIEEIKQRLNSVPPAP